MLLLLSAATALAYGLWLTDRPVSTLRSLIKTLPLTCLALAAALSDNPLACLALALSAAGDLALSRSGPRAFLAGLTSFALAHLAFLGLFLPGGGMPPPAAALPLLALAASTPLWLLPHAGARRRPVAVYVALVTAMGLAAWGHPDPLVRVGATAFVLSDMLLALHLFRGVRGFSRPLWSLYWLGQALISAGLGVAFRQGWP